MSAPVPPRRIVVMQSFPGIRPTTNPYLRMLVDAVSTDVDVVYFSWRRAIFGSVDVIHIHWPELMMRGRTEWRSLVRRLLVRVLLVRVKRSSIAVVRTAHNQLEHEVRGRAVGTMIDRVERATTMWIRLNRHTVTPVGVPSSIIPHGHYRSGATPISTRSVPRRMLIFGLIRPYKGVEGAIRAFADLEDEDAVLRVVGSAATPGLAEQVQRLASADSRVSLDLRYVDEGELADEIRLAELIVLPYLAMHNSGAVLLALSLDRPCLVPRTDVTEDLVGEVGEQWVRTFDGRLSAGILASASEWVAATEPDRRGRRPDLSAREWEAIGRRHVQVYLDAVTLARSHSDGLAA